MFIGKLIPEAPIFPHNDPSIFHPWAKTDRSFVVTSTPISVSILRTNTYIPNLSCNCCK